MAWKLDCKPFPPAVLAYGEEEQTRGSNRCNLELWKRSWYNSSKDLNLLKRKTQKLMSWKSFQNVICMLAGLLVLGTTTAASMANDDAAAKPPAQLVRRAVQNEMNANNGPGVHFMFTDRKKTAHLSQTRLIVETREATAGITVAQDDHRLTPQELEAEEARLENYIRNPEELNKKRKQEKEDAERTERILRALPDAFLYEADGIERGSDAIGRAGDELVKLKFRPDPSYVPPTRVEQVLTGMSGHLLIDAKQDRVAEIDGTLQKEVGFGWGILGHLDRGGRFLVQQADVSDHHWEVTRMELTFTGKIFFFKKLNIRSSDLFSDFHEVSSDLTFAQGVELLQKKIAQEQSGVEKSENTSREAQLPKKDNDQAREAGGTEGISRR